MKRTLVVAMCAALLTTVPLGAAWAQTPDLTVWANPALGQWTFDATTATPIPLEIGDDESIGFSWQGDASAYGGTVVGYRYGWDLVDVNDPNDPGWGTPDFGPAEFTSLHTFSTGVHGFSIAVKDDAGAVTRADFLITVVVSVADTPAAWGAVKATYR